MAKEPDKKSSGIEQEEKKTAQERVATLLDVSPVSPIMQKLVEKFPEIAERMNAKLVQDKKDFDIKSARLKFLTDQMNSQAKLAKQVREGGDDDFADQIMAGLQEDFIVSNQLQNELKAIVSGVSAEEEQTQEENEIIKISKDLEFTREEFDEMIQDPILAQSTINDIREAGSLDDAQNLSDRIAFDMRANIGQNFIGDEDIAELEGRSAEPVEPASVEAPVEVGQSESAFRNIKENLSAALNANTFGLANKLRSAIAKGKN